MDETLLNSESLASPARGAKQLERVLPKYRQQAENWNALLDYDTLSLEERAALDASLLEMPELASLIDIVPSENDLSIEVAEKIARKAISEKYGVAEEILSSAPAHVSFLLYGDTNSRQYRFDLGDYIAWVTSPDGEVTDCRWMVDAKERVHPEGDLSKYPEVAAEFVISGAFDLLPFTRPWWSMTEAASGLLRISRRQASIGIGPILRSWVHTRLALMRLTERCVHKAGRYRICRWMYTPSTLLVCSRFQRSHACMGTGFAQ